MSFGQAAHRQTARWRSNGHAAQFMPAKSERGLNGVPSSPNRQPGHAKGVPNAAIRDIPATRVGDEIDFSHLTVDTARMVEKDIHIVARSAGIPLAGCRDDDHAT